MAICRFPKEIKTRSTPEAPMDHCQEKIIHGQAVETANRSLPESAAILKISEIFKALSDPSRLKIVLALDACELCVCDLSAVTGLSESAVSHQLRTLRNLKVVRNRRDGKIVFYRLDDAHVAALLQQSLAHVCEPEPVP
jgi:DNA-binding transcriptional ArsR family regulator